MPLTVTREQEHVQNTRTARCHHNGLACHYSTSPANLRLATQRAQLVPGLLSGTRGHRPLAGGLLCLCVKPNKVGTEPPPILQAQNQAPPLPLRLPVPAENSSRDAWPRAPPRRSVTKDSGTGHSINGAASSGPAAPLRTPQGTHADGQPPAHTVPSRSVSPPRPVPARYLRAAARPGRPRSGGVPSAPAAPREPQAPAWRPLEGESASHPLSCSPAALRSAPPWRLRPELPAGEAGKGRAIPHTAGHPEAWGN